MEYKYSSIVLKTGFVSEYSSTRIIKKNVKFIKTNLNRNVLSKQQEH